MKVGRTTLTRALATRLTDPKLAEETAAYLLSEHRVGELESLGRDLEQYRADHQSIIEVTAVSARPLDSQSLDEIQATIQRAYPEAQRIIIIERIDANLIGGVRLELANQLIDLSIRAKLNKFKQLTVAGKD